MSKLTKPRWTLEHASSILEALRRRGLNPRLVGSLASVGASEHDIDIALPIKSRVQYSRYRGTVRSLGFKEIEGAFDHMEHDLETWAGPKGLVDVWMEE